MEERGWRGSRPGGAGALCCSRGDGSGAAGRAGARRPSFEGGRNAWGLGAPSRSARSLPVAAAATISTAAYELELEQKAGNRCAKSCAGWQLEAPEEIHVISGRRSSTATARSCTWRAGKSATSRTARAGWWRWTSARSRRPKINQALGALREMLADRRFPRFLRSLELFTNEAGSAAQLLETGQPVRGAFSTGVWSGCRVFTGGRLSTRSGRIFTECGHRSFFQVNRFLIEQMVIRSGGRGGETALELVPEWACFPCRWRGGSRRLEPRWILGQRSRRPGVQRGARRVRRFRKAAGGGGVSGVAGEGAGCRPGRPAARRAGQDRRAPSCCGCARARLVVWRATRTWRATGRAHGRRYAIERMTLIDLFPRRSTSRRWWGWVGLTTRATSRPSRIGE